MDAMPLLTRTVFDTELDAAAVTAAAERAAKRVAPLWPLDSFVAVNPYLGLAGDSFTEAAASLARTAGARMTMPRSFYAGAIATGRITPVDLAEGLAASPALATSFTPESLAAFANVADESAPAPLPTFADVAAGVTGRDWASLVIDRISAFAAGFFDRGQASWTEPARAEGFYEGWHEDARIDLAFDIAGARGFRAAVAKLPADADGMLHVGALRLGLSSGELDAYFERLLRSIGGWAAFARGRDWPLEQSGAEGTLVKGLLAVRLAHDVALMSAFAANGALRGAFARVRHAFAEPADATAFAGDALLQAAYERAWQRQFLPRLKAPAGLIEAERPAVQAVFCIDVRSEVFRRSLETAAPSIETLGFAGFFGVALEHVALGESEGAAQCPVLLSPRFVICEAVDAPDAAAAERRISARRIGGDAARALKAFRSAAVSSFAFVEALGLAYFGKLAANSAGLAKAPPVIDAETAPTLAPALVDGRRTGMAEAERIATAEAILRGMGLTGGFARLVLLAGHGATTLNNPHAAGLDCGACGGHGGAPNARVAATLLNDVAVRFGLAARGIAIPADTVFLAGLHDTTTDSVTLLDLQHVPASHAADCEALQAALALAGRLTRSERAPRLGIESTDAIDAKVMRRAQDWSEVRPEWGLAGCAAFVAAPRAVTQALDLEGRVFLHSYDWRRDKDFRTLELILTAPVVVASWINLQYYGSTVDNRVFGSGNKVLHNVVGGVGVLEGFSGDLRTGLPWQSLHDGTRLMHEPMRLSVVVAAPTEAIDRVLAAHAGLRQLVENGWIHLFSLADDGAMRWTSEGWEMEA